MRNISFALTTEQVKNRTKTVTRRIGWKNLKPGTLLQPVEKAQGLKKGEHVTKIGGPIKVVSVRQEPLREMYHAAIGLREARYEGFPHLNGKQFVAFFCEHNGCTPDDEVTRIEFEYV